MSRVSVVALLASFLALPAVAAQHAETDVGPTPWQGERPGVARDEVGFEPDEELLGGASRDPRGVLAGTVPLAEVRRYAMDLRAMTAGRGSYVMGEVRYDVLPDHLVDAVLAEYED